MRFRPTLLSVVLLLGGFIWTTAAIAAVENRQAHPVYTNSRSQIGNGLPIPITGQAAPWGRIKPPTASPTLMQQTTPFTVSSALPSGRAITMAPTLLTAPGNPVNLPVFLANPNVFQVRTSITIAFPSASAQLAGSGRTGPPTATFCAGQSLGSPSAPVCTGPGDPNNTINGLMRYTRTANQFGGPAQGLLPAQPAGAEGFVRVVGERVGVLRDHQVADVEVPVFGLALARRDHVHVDVERARRRGVE